MTVKIAKQLQASCPASQANKEEAVVKEQGGCTALLLYTGKLGLDLIFRRFFTHNVWNSTESDRKRR